MEIRIDEETKKFIEWKFPPRIITLEYDRLGNQPVARIGKTRHYTAAEYGERQVNGITVFVANALANRYVRLDVGTIKRALFFRLLHVMGTEREQEANDAR